MTHNIVLIDDNFTLRQVLKVYLSHISESYDVKFNIYSSDNGVEGLGFVYITRPELVIIDTTLPKYSGRDVIEYLVNNISLQDSGITYIVIGDQSSSIPLPNNFSYVNKKSSDFFKELKAKLLKALFVEGNESSHRIFHKFAEKTLELSVSAESVENDIRRKKNTLKRIFLTWLDMRIVVRLALLSLFSKIPKDSNPEQQKQDRFAYRSKYYPIFVGIVSMFIILWVFLVVLGVSQGIIMSQQRVSIDAFEAELTETPIYFNLPYDITIDNKGFIYVADTYSHKIQKFDVQGSFMMEWGELGSADGQLRYPFGITSDSFGNIYVTDSGNSRVVKFSPIGSFLSKWGKEGNGKGEFSRPIGIVADDKDDIYVVDSGNNRVQKFDDQGNFILEWGNTGSINNQFSNPMGITVDDLGNVFVADTYNHSIKKFKSNGEFISSFGSFGTDIEDFGYPTSLIVFNSKIYVSDSYNNRLKIIDTNGNYLDVWGFSGNEPGNFKNLNGLAIDLENNLYVVDTDNFRIQKFHLDGTLLGAWGKKLPSE